MAADFAANYQVDFWLSTVGIGLEWSSLDSRRLARAITKPLSGDVLMPASATPAQVIAAVRKTPGHRVKVAVSDIDGILRGKYIHKDKFESAVEGGFGFC